MPEPWLPGAERIGCTRTGGSYDGTPYCFVVHTTEGVPSTIAACRRMAETHTSPPQLWYHPELDWLAQGIPLTRSGYALAHPPGAPETNKAGAIQVELFGFARDTPNWPVEWLDRIGTRILRAIIDAGYPIDLNQVAATTGNDGYGYNGAVRFSAQQWARFPGVCCHSNVCFNEHWDAGAINLQRIVDAARGSSVVPAPGGDMTPTHCVDRNGDHWFFIVGTDSDVWASVNNSGFFPVVPRGPDGKPRTAFTSGLSAIMTPDGALTVAGRGGDGRGWHVVFTPGDPTPPYVGVIDSHPHQIHA